MRKFAISAFCSVCLLAGSLFASGFPSCKSPSVLLYSVEDEYPATVRLPSIAVNNKKTKERAIRLFRSVYLNPFHAKDAEHLADLLRVDSINAVSHFSQLKKPKVLYSDLSLYEKSKYSVSELEKLKKEEERYRLQLKKASQIASNTRAFDPFSFNKKVVDAMKLTVLFSTDPLVKKRIFEALFSSKARSALGSRFSRDDFFTEMFKLSLLESGEDYFYKMSDIKTPSFLFQDTLLANKTIDGPLDVVGRYFFHLFFGKTPPELSKKELSVLSGEARSILDSVCGKSHVSVEASPFSVMTLFVLSKVLPREKENLYAAYQALYPRGDKFWEMLEVWSYSKTNVPRDVDINMLYPLMDDSSKKEAGQTVALAIPALQWRMDRVGDYIDPYLVSRLALQKGILSGEDENKMRRVFSSALLGVQRYFMKKGNAREGYKIFSLVNEILDR